MDFFFQPGIAAVEAGGVSFFFHFFKVGMAEGGDFFSAGDAPLFFIAVGVFHVQPAARREPVFGQAAVFQHGGGEAGFFRRFFFGEGIAVVVDAQFQSGGEDAVYLFIETAVQVAFSPA